VRAVIYARISKDATGEEAGVQRQVDACTHLAMAREWQLAGEPLVDNDISAFNGAHRPGWEAVLGMIARREVDAVICWHMDRMCRRVADLVDLLKLAVGDGKRPGVKVATVHGDLDLSSPVGRMFATILIAVAEYEAAHKGERQQAAEQKRAAAGQRKLGTPRPFGYQDDRVTARADEADAIRWAADALLGGGTVSAVMREWNRRGLRSPQKGGKPLSRSSVTTILRNPALAGLSAYKGEIAGAGTWEAILPEETWRAVDALLADPARKPPRGVRTLLGGLAACACGNVVSGSVSHLGQHVYRCQPSTRGGRPGPHVAVRAEPVDEWVTGAVVEALSSPDLADVVTPPPHADTTGLRAEAAAIRRNLDEMGADRALGLVSRSQMLAATERGNARLAGIAAELAEAAGAGALVPFTRGEAAAGVWKSLDLSRRREVIRTLTPVILHPAGRGARGYDLASKVDMPGLRGE
jgi:DNA invertase Pin-like site-specific DNA recombinase